MGYGGVAQIGLIKMESGLKAWVWLRIQYHQEDSFAWKAGNGNILKSDDMISESKEKNYGGWELLFPSTAESLALTAFEFNSMVAIVIITDVIIFTIIIRWMILKEDFKYNGPCPPYPLL